VRVDPFDAYGRNLESMDAEKKMMTKRTRAPKRRGIIPLCKSSFLQDVTIAFGRRSLKSLRYSTSDLRFDVQTDEVGGSELERLDAEARTYTGRMTKVSIWENGESWVYSREREMRAADPAILNAYGDLRGMDADEVAELLLATLRDISAVKTFWISIGKNHR